MWLQSGCVFGFSFQHGLMNFVAYRCVWILDTFIVSSVNLDKLINFLVFISLICKMENHFMRVLWGLNEEMKYEETPNSP